jgi:type I restriction enzyme S subunit
MSTDSWPSFTVEECLVPVNVGSRPTIAVKDYKPSGQWPIVDQGQKEIAGWTDSERSVILEPLPLIIFGDHTRTFKFVDFAFARGADGTQLLKPRDDIDPRFFFYACRSIDLGSRGYNRHFRLLKEQTISIPSEIEQQRTIASVLQLTESALNRQIALLDTLEELSRASMTALFTQGIRDEPLQDSEIGPLPKSWTVERLDSIADVISTRMAYSELESLQPSKSADQVRVLGVKVSDMNRLGNEVEISQAALDVTADLDIAEHRFAPPGTIIFPKRGAAIATNKKRIATTWTVFDPNIIGVRARPGLSQRFLFQWFQAFDLRTITEPGPTPQLNKKNLDPLLVPVPSEIEEQEEIVRVLDALDRKVEIHRQKRVVLAELLASLLRDLTTGVVMVSELDLTSLSPLDEPVKVPA